MKAPTTLAPIVRGVHQRSLLTLGSIAKMAILAVVVQGPGFVPAEAATFTTNASVRSWYSEQGTANNTDYSYAAGIAGGTQVHNYFIFTLPNTPDLITSAELRLWNPSNGYYSFDDTETLTLYNVSTSIALLGTNSIATYTDLGSGPSYGSVTVGASSNGTYVSIMLNANFLAAAQVAKGTAGRQIAIGGTLTTLYPDDNEYLFGYTGSLTAASNAQLVTTTTVPEPSTWALLGLGAVMWFAARRTGIWDKAS